MINFKRKILIFRVSSILEKTFQIPAPFKEFNDMHKACVIVYFQLMRNLLNMERLEGPFDTDEGLLGRVDGF